MTIDTRIERLSAAASNRIIEPDVDLVGEIRPGQIIPDELLTIHGLDLDLTPEQKATLSREETAAMLRSGIAFEAILNSGFSMQIAKSTNLTDPRITFLLHEIGEETKHQRLFQRVLRQLDPQAKRRTMSLFDSALEAVGPHLIISLPALLLTLVLAGEEIPDLVQKRASEHPDTDPFLAEVNRYHRAEEARHLSYARAVYPETWEKANLAERVAVRHVAPLVITDLFRFLVSPGVYETIGLPAKDTWDAVQACPVRIALRHEAIRPVLRVLLDAGGFGR
ncbi:MAG: diiron oxygenase [Acidimicrobiales bacterium]